MSGILVAFAAGALLSWRLWPTRAKPAVLLAALALPAGLSATSSAYFLWLVVSGGRASCYPWLEIAALAVAIVFAWRRGRERGDRLLLPPRPRLGREVAALLVLAFAALAALLIVLRHAQATPWGYWDAWARINLKARFLHEGGSGWTWIFTGEGGTHPDYPLLLPCSVARLWHWSGGIGPLPPQVLSVLGWAGCFVALVSLAARLRPGSVISALAGLAFLCQRSDLAWAGMQYADFALATFFVWTAGLLVLGVRRRARAAHWFPLIGFCAASAAWCKNEGLVFVALVVLACGVSVFRAPGRTRAAWALGRGILLGGLAPLVLKLGFAGASDLFAARARPLFVDLCDASRYRVVGGYLARHLGAELEGGALLALGLALVLLARGRGVRSWLPIGLCLAMALVFLLVLTATPLDLDWLVGTTIDRLALQLWPLTVLGLVLAARGEG